MYQNLTEGTSVHLSDWPRANKKAINEKLNKEMNTVRLVVTLGLGARAKAQIKVRQPLAKLTMSGSAEEARLIEKNKDIVLSELNVKELLVQDHAPDSVVIKLSPLARVLGPKYGGDVQYIIRAAKAGNFEVTKNGFVVRGETQSWNLLADEAELVYESKEGQAVEASAGVVVALDVNITPALKQEGIARDIVRAVQDLRKEAKLDVSDRIHVVVITENQEIQSAIDACAPYIQEETLATSLVDKVENPIARTQVTLEGSVVTIALSKA
jgi:isoleucyl-tRNA synthetase